MSEHAEFLAEILANPDDVSARLVYADWLEDRGDPRAEFIRVQCRLAEITEEEPEFRKLKERELELIRAHKAEWVSEVEPLVQSPRLMRGFVENIAVGTQQFYEHRKRLFELAPIRHVNVMRLGEIVAELLKDCPEWRHVRSLDLWSNTLPAPSLHSFLNSPHFSGLERLQLGQANRSVIFDMDAPRGVQSLRELNMSQNGISEAFAPGLGHSWIGQLAKLECLRMEHCRLRSGSLTVLLSATFPRLTALYLANNPLKDEGAAILARCPRLDRLHTLDLRHTDLGAAGVGALAESPYLKTVKRLDLSDSKLTPAAVEALVNAFQPTTLKLNNCSLTDGSAEILAGASSLSGLRILDLEGNRGRKGLTNASAKALLKSPYLTSLTVLNLKEAAIDRDVQKQLRAHFGVGVCTFSAK